MLEEIRNGKGIEGKDYLHLDLAHLGKEVLETKLSEITGFARTYAGVDPVQEPIPVHPTCHYMMGGIATNADGNVIIDDEGTTFPGLYAAGECACVSVHGSNRLGCNSLLDLLVFGRRAGKEMNRAVPTMKLAKLPPNAEKEMAKRINALMGNKGKERSSHIRSELQELMMDKVSVFRTGENLLRALEKIRELKERYHQVSLQDEGNCFNRDLLEAIELEYMLDLAEVISIGALNREESRGAHYREDYPARDDEKWLVHTFCKFSDVEEPQVSYKPVTITRFQPKERTY
jgi:succinate dehydrogenase / fumarate reductase flavoprotein subunit